MKQTLIWSYFPLLLGKFWWDIWSVVRRGERESIQYNRHSNPLTLAARTFRLINYFHIFATNTFSNLDKYILWFRKSNPLTLAARTFRLVIYFHIFASHHLFVKSPNNSVGIFPIIWSSKRKGYTLVQIPLTSDKIWSNSISFSSCHICPSPG